MTIAGQDCHHTRHLKHATGIWATSRHCAQYLPTCSDLACVTGSVARSSYLLDSGAALATLQHYEI